MMIANSKTNQIDPRVVQTRNVVLEAGRDLLFNEGRDAVTAVRIAERTGVARTTIYRHWPDQTRLLLATIASCGPEIEYEPTGDLRQDLIAYLAKGSRMHAEFPVEQLFAMMTDLADHSDEVAGYMKEMHKVRTGPVFQMLAAASDRGELRSDLDLGDATTILIGPLFFRKLVVMQPITDEFIETVVDQFLRGAAPD